MKTLFFITPILFALSAFGQNEIQNNISNINMQQRFMQVNQVFASNMMGNASNTNKPVRANANPQIQVQHVSTANSAPRRQVRRTVRSVTTTNLSNPIQTNVINIADNNNEVQQLLKVNSVSDNNVGNAFGNEGLIEQIASANIPAIQVGTGSLSLRIDMSTIKLPAIKLSSKKSVSGSKHKQYTLKKKLAKLNRNLGGKLAVKKRLKIKVDNCFKW